MGRGVAFARRELGRVNDLFHRTDRQVTLYGDKATQRRLSSCFVISQFAQIDFIQYVFKSIVVHLRRVIPLPSW
jgi:hypothetical protein